MTTKAALFESLARLEKERKRLEGVRSIVGGGTQINFSIHTSGYNEPVELTRATMNGYYTYELDKAYDLVKKGFREGCEALLSQNADSIRRIKDKIIVCLDQEILDLRK